MNPRPGRLAVAARLLRVAATAAVLALRCLALAARHGRRGSRERRLGLVVDAAERLGPAFVKIGQLLAARPDLAAPDVRASFARLFDETTPLPPAVAAAIVGRTPAGDRAGRDALAAALTAPALASGSIASVFAVPAGATRYAVKVRRPEAAGLMHRDLTILGGLAGGAERLGLSGGLPVRAIVADLSGTIARQLDLDAERAALRALRTTLADVDGVLVPAPSDQLSGPDVLVMELVEEVAGSSWETLSPAARAAAAARAMHAVCRMLFIDGIVHCDLHPGNLVPLSDGRIVVLDAGFCRTLAVPTRRAFAQFFDHLILGDGPAAADVVLANSVPGRDADRHAFHAGIAALVESATGRSAAEFDLVGFVTRLFALQRAHRMVAAAEFVYPLLMLLVVEGIVTTYAPDLDFQLEAAPYVMTGLVSLQGEP